jgi:hypothetical protein
MRQQRANADRDQSQRVDSGNHAAPQVENHNRLSLQPMHRKAEAQHMPANRGGSHCQRRKS